jgi:exopolysaccharide biosynthesis polyprenyl glycosylphosphotransferase
LDAESHGRERWLRQALLLADMAAVALALVVTIVVTSPASLSPLGLLLPLPLIVAAAKCLGLYHSDDQRIHKTTAEELPRIAQLGVLLVLGAWLGDEPLWGGPAGKAQVLILGTIFVVAAVLGRRAARRLAARRLPRERCLFVGDDLSCRRLTTIFERHGLPAGVVCRVSVEDMQSQATTRVALEAEVLQELIVLTEAHRVIIGPHRVSNELTFELLEAARRAGTRISLLPDMLEVVGSSVDFDDLYGVTLLGVRPSELSRSSLLLKRAFDVVGASVLLLLSAPLMIAMAAAIRLDSPGPVLFRQLRIGRGGKPFRIFKLRTMVADADALKDGLRPLNEAIGLFKISDDPRITRVGRVLRRRSLDELAQLFNVLLGSMSLVGPRPLVADEDSHIRGTDRGRLRLTPGMTGQWQIYGSTRIPLDDMVKLDQLYVTNWSLWGDVKILLRTVPYVLDSRGL